MKEDIGILAGTSNALFIRAHPYGGGAIIGDVAQYLEFLTFRYRMEKFKYLETNFLNL